MGEKKVVGRTVAIVLGVICVILTVGLVGAIANYTSIISGKDNNIVTKDSQIQTLTNQKNQLQTWLDGNKTLLNQTQTWLDGNITYYNSQISSLSSEIATVQGQKDQLQSWLNGNITSYEAQISSLNVQINQLQSWLNGNITYYTSQINSLNSQITNLQNQITDLQNQIDTLKAPKLIKVNLEADDFIHVYPWDDASHLHVYGYICNVGTNTAYSSKIHVVAYQSGGVVAIDTYITLGTIYGESWTSVDSSVYYSGSELVSWTLTLEWAS